MLTLVNGDYVRQGDGLQEVSGKEALLQRILLRLTAHRGQFPFMEAFGSRLWTLGELKASDRQAAAEQYTAEALSDEEGLTVERVTLTEQGDGSALLTVEVSANGTSLAVNTAIR